MRRRRAGLVRQLDLAQRPVQRRAADHHRAGAAVVADGNFQPVGQQRVVGVAEHAADIGGVLLGRIEIRVAGNVDGQVHHGLRHRHQRAAAQGGVVLHVRVRGAEQCLQACARLVPHRPAQRDERIERAGAEGAASGGRQQAGIVQRPQVDHLIAQRHARARRRVGLRGEDAIGQVLQREMRLGRVGGGEPARLSCGHVGSGAWGGSDRPWGRLSAWPGRNASSGPASTRSTWPAAAPIRPRNVSGGSRRGSRT